MISFTQGDTATLILTATDGNGNPINLTDAVFTTFIRGMNGVTLSFSNSQHTIISAVNGQFSLALASGDTASCGLGANKEIITMIVQEESIIYFHGVNLLTVNPSVPLQ